MWTRNANASDSPRFLLLRKKNAVKHNGQRNVSNKKHVEIDGPIETIEGHVRMHPQALPTPVANEQAMLREVIVVQQARDVAGLVAPTREAAAKVAAGRGVVMAGVRVAAIRVAVVGTIAVEIAETGTKEPKRIPHHVVQSRSNELNRKSRSLRRCNKAKNRSDPSRI